MGFGVLEVIERVEGELSAVRGLGWRHGCVSEAVGRPDGGESQWRRVGGEAELLGPRCVSPVPYWALPSRPLPTHGTFAMVLCFVVDNPK